MFQHNSRSTCYEVCEISKAEADQRAGRAGRTCPGTCYRLYSLGDYNNLQDRPPAAVHTESPDALLLMLRQLPPVLESMLRWINAPGK